MSLIATLLSRPSHPSIHTATNRQPAALLAKGQQLMVGFKVNFTRLEGSQWKPETHSFLYCSSIFTLCPRNSDVSWDSNKGTKES